MKNEKKIVDILNVIQDAYSFAGTCYHNIVFTKKDSDDNSVNKSGYDQVIDNLFNNPHYSLYSSYVTKLKRKLKSLSPQYILINGKYNISLTDESLILMNNTKKRYSRRYHANNMNDIIKYLKSPVSVEMEEYKCKTVFNNGVEIFTYACHGGCRGVLTFYIKATLKIHQEIMKVAINSNDSYYDPTLKENVDKIPSS